MSENIVLEKSFAFALKIVGLYKYLAEERREFVLSRKLLDAGTSVGARVKSAQEAPAKTIFAAEIGGALQKASETEYWLQLLNAGGFLDEGAFGPIHQDCVEVIRLLTRISKSTQPRM